MSGHLVGELLHDFAQGAMRGPERRDWEKHVAGCIECEAAVVEALEIGGALALALPAGAPSGDARARLMQAASGKQLEAMADRLGRFFDLAIAEVRKLLDDARDPAQWEKPGMEGLSLFHLQPGPAHAGADAGLVRFAAGLKFPRHRHLGEERVLMVTGGIVEGDGTMLLPGDVSVMAKDTEHWFETLPGEDAMYALVLYTGIEIEGVGALSTKKKE